MTVFWLLWREQAPPPRGPEEPDPLGMLLCPVLAHRLVPSLFLPPVNCG